jgi:hypothetical protein
VAEGLLDRGAVDELQASSPRGRRSSVSRWLQHEPRVRCPFVDGRLIATVKDEDGNVIGLLQDPA